MTTDPPQICFTIDVERDYRLDDRLTVRGITEGLPAFIDLFRKKGIPFDLMISAEIIPFLHAQVFTNTGDLLTLGCHGNSHVPGYLNRMSTSAQESDIRRATGLIQRAYDRAPVSFRAPNFSADGRTIRILKSLGYLADSSVLPDRWVRRWRILPLVDHRGAPESPYMTDESHFPLPGTSQILEVPVTPNRVLPGGPLGLGFLNSHGPVAFREAMALNRCRYVVVLGHSWEMVSWERDDPVAPWVRTAASAGLSRLATLIEALGDHSFVNTAGILAAERTT